VARDPAANILEIWTRLKRYPFGRWIFNFLLRRLVPYTGTISPIVRHLEPGRAEVEIKDRRRVRNHLRSIHATALVTLGEAASGLALIAALPADQRSILVGFEIEYFKKARGTLTAESTAPTIETSNERREVLIESSIFDASRNEVAHATARWLVGPR